MVILLLLGFGLLWYGRRLTSNQITDEERSMRNILLIKTLLKKGPDGLLPIIGGMTIQVSGLLIIYSTLFNT
jgi:hypothetical protein